MDDLNNDEEQIMEYRNLFFQQLNHIMSSALTYSQNIPEDTVMNIVNLVLNNLNWALHNEEEMIQLGQVMYKFALEQGKKDKEKCAAMESGFDNVSDMINDLESKMGITNEEE